MDTMRTDGIQSPTVVSIHIARLRPPEPDPTFKLPRRSGQQAPTAKQKWRRRSTTAMSSIEMKKERGPSGPRECQLFIVHKAFWTRQE